MEDDDESVVCQGSYALGLQASNDLLVSNYCVVAGGVSELTLHDVCGEIGEHNEDIDDDDDDEDEEEEYDTDDEFVNMALAEVCIASLWKSPTVGACYDGDEPPPEDSEDDDDDVSEAIGVDVGARRRRSSRSRSRSRRGGRKRPPPPGRPPPSSRSRGRGTPRPRGAPRGRGRGRGFSPSRGRARGRGVTPGRARPLQPLPPSRGRWPPAPRGRGRVAPPPTAQPPPPSQTVPGFPPPQQQYPQQQFVPVPVPTPTPFPVPMPYPQPVPYPQPGVPAPYAPPAYGGLVPMQPTGLCPPGYYPSQTYPGYCAPVVQPRPGFQPPVPYYGTQQYREPGFRDALKRKVIRRRSQNVPLGYQASGAFTQSQRGVPPQIHAANLGRAANYMAAGAAQIFQQQTGIVPTHEQKTALRRRAWDQAKAANRFASRGFGGQSMNSGGYQFPAPRRHQSEQVGYYPVLTVGLPDDDESPLPATYGMDQDTVRIFLMNTMLDVSRQMGQYLLNMIQTVKSRAQ